MQNKFIKNRFFYSSSFIGLIIAVWCCQLVAKPNSRMSQHPASAAIQIQARDLSPKVLNLALSAYNNAKKAGHGSNDYLTIVDYSLPSTKPRMWVIDMRTKSVVHHTHVAHGTGSGDNYAHKFSNRSGSHMSSLGLFLTGDLYNGHYGKSLTLHGLDGKFNSNAYARRIVVHQAHYVDESVIKKIGRLGRSFGCLALNKRVANDIMHKIKGGSLVFCYYPDSTWLKEAPMLNA